MEEPTTDIVTIPIETATIVLVQWLYNPEDGPNGESVPCPKWIEVRFPNEKARCISDLSEIPTLFSQDSLKNSLHRDARFWARMVSIVFPTPVVLGNMPPLTCTYIFRSIDIREMSPWVHGDYLFFLGIESIVDFPEAAILAFRMSISTFGIEKRWAASIEALQSGDLVWSYSRQDIAALFESNFAHVSHP